MGKWRGLFEDTFLEVDATSYEDAKEKMKQILIKQIQEGDENFWIYELDAEKE